MTAAEPLEAGIEDVAAFLGVSVQTVYAWRKHGGGPRGYRVGKHVRFRWSEVEEWLQRQREAS